MAAALWKNEIVAAGLSAQFAEKFVALGYESKEDFQNACVDNKMLEQFIHHALVTKKLAEAEVREEEWGFHPLAGKLRKLWKTCNPPAEAPPVVASGSAHLPLLTALPSSKLDTLEREKLLKEFRGKFPGVALSPETLPASGFLAVVQQQCRSQAWAWLPWKRILSEAACGEMQQRKVVGKRDMADIVAEASGLCPEEWDLDLAASPHRISLLVRTRAHAYAMCAGGHLCSWMEYGNRFIMHYARKPGAGWRSFTPQEAEMADREVMTEVFRLVLQDGNELDAALRAVVREDLFRHYFVPQPKLLLKPPAPSRPPLDRKRKRSGQPGECFAWIEGKCARKNCRFLHACGLCGDPSHCSNSCEKKKKSS